MSRVRIGEQWVGESEPVYIIAEAGSNHNGNFDQALRLIDVAAAAGANAVKFQNFRAERMYPRSAGSSDYLRTSTPIFEIIEAMEMPESWVPRLAACAVECGLAFISSPFDEASADLVAPFVAAFKIASYEMTHVPLLRHAARYGKPMIVSTGTANLREVLDAIATIRSEGNQQLIVLQCTASYPTPPEAVNARAIATLREATGLPVGFSDHSRDPVLAPTVAVALGACVVEKHFTLSNRLPGPDHQFAVEPDELGLMVRSIRVAEKMLGDGRKETLPVEQELHSFARRSVFTTRSIRAGETLTVENIAVLRCGKLGFGLSTDHYDALLGRIATRDLPAETPIRLADLR